MSTIFESKVYALRQAAPFCTPSPLRFMRAIVEFSSDAEAKFSVVYRGDVASRLWWEMEWTQHGHQCRAQAQTSDLCLWRAMEIWKEVEREHQLEYSVNNRKATDWRCLSGWMDGDGI